MALTGKQKAAMLLTSLDPATAAELLKGVDGETVQELAVELAYLDAAGYSSKQSLDLARQFYNSLQTGKGLHIKSFLKEMLEGTVGEEKAKQTQSQIQGLLQKRDPFTAIRSVDSQTIASILENERPQAVAVVLSELSPEKSSEVLHLLREGIQLSAISRMSSCEAVTAEAKARIAETACKQLRAITIAGESGAQSQPEQALRKVAVILRNVGKELRDGLLRAVRGRDPRIREVVTDLMIVWEDIPQVADRSLKEALRQVDAQKLALALVKADHMLVQKIKSNMSERAAATMDEEVSLMSDPRREDIEAAREEIVEVLREMNEKGELAFMEEQCDAS